jgi:DNA-binding GntR family transcriptional regulator
MDIGVEKREGKRGGASALVLIGNVPGDAQLPLHGRVHRGLRAMIDSRVLPSGLVLLEGPIANYFGVSRVPVRKALADLAASGVIRRFRGRGYLVDPEQRNPMPLRFPFQSLDLPGRSGGGFQRQRTYEWQRVHDDIAEEIAQCLLFGTYQIREAGLCERYRISRTVVREVLGRLMARGIIDKDRRSHWICGPFTARANSEQYQMRMILEPAALGQCVQAGALPDVRAMIERLDEVRSGPAPPSAARIAGLDDDLHGALFEQCTNARLKAGIVQNQLALNVNRTFYRHFGVSADEPMLDEHRKVLTALVAGKIGDAQAALTAHLAAARERSQARLKVLAVIEEPDLPDFLERTH